VVTGASSGIGRAFAAIWRRPASSRPRRPTTCHLDEIGRTSPNGTASVSGRRVDLADPDFLRTLIDATDDLDLGLVGLQRRAT